MIKYAESAETILKRLKNGITNVDTDEGSFIHDSQAPISIEQAEIKIEMDEIIKRVFAHIAIEEGYDDDVIARCAENGVELKEGNKAMTELTITGVAGSTIPSGGLVKTPSGLVYILMEDAIIQEGATTTTAWIEAENIGSQYNVPRGTITQMPIKYIGITSVTNLKEVVNGFDNEKVTDLYKRYLSSIQNPSKSGSKNDYLMWVLY